MVSVTAVLLMLAAIWVVTGLLTGLAMGRHGHDPFAWWLLGSLLGPLVVPVAVAAVRWSQGASRILGEGAAARGRVDVLVGVDGSPHAAGALSAALELVGPRLGRLTLAGVTGLDDSAERRQQERRLQAELERQAAAVRSWLAGQGLVPAFTHWEPEMVLSAGPPAAALRQFAVDGRYDLLVVGCRGHGRGNAPLGSTATALAAGSKVPVLLAGEDQPERAGRTAHTDRSTPRPAGCR